jgi:hypothetical protein
MGNPLRKYRVTKSDLQLDTGKAIDYNWGYKSGLSDDHIKAGFKPFLKY